MIIQTIILLSCINTYLTSKIKERGKYMVSSSELKAEIQYWMSSNSIRGWLIKEVSFDNDHEIVRVVIAKPDATDLDCRRAKEAVIAACRTRIRSFRQEIVVNRYSY